MTMMLWPMFGVGFGALRAALLLSAQCSVQQRGQRRLEAPHRGTLGGLAEVLLNKFLGMGERTGFQCVFDFWK